ncbi:MAG: tetratricopeptide repeat protein [Verrucomicrobiota bacterium]
MDTVETTQSTADIKFLTWLEENKKRLVVGVGVAIGIAVIVTCYNYYSEQQEVNASEALTGLRGPIPGVSKAPPATSAQYFKVAEQYSGTSAAAQASLMGAEALYNEGKYAEAQAAFEKFLAQNGSHPMVAQAVLGIATCLDAAGKPNDALAKYQDASRQYSYDLSVVSISKLAMARIYEAQAKFSEAFKTYKDMADMSRGQMYNPWMDEAQERLRLLAKAHPEVIPVEKFEAPKPVNVTPAPSSPVSTAPRAPISQPPAKSPAPKK